MNDRLIAWAVMAGVLVFWLMFGKKIRGRHVLAGFILVALVIYMARPLVNILAVWDMSPDKRLALYEIGAIFLLSLACVSWTGYRMDFEGLGGHSKHDSEVHRILGWLTVLLFCMFWGVVVFAK